MNQGSISSGDKKHFSTRSVEIDSGAPTPLQLVPKSLSSEVKLPGREADHSLSLRVRMLGALPPFITHLHDVILNKAQEQEEVFFGLSGAVLSP
jgi:hypothetical protein